MRRGLILAGVALACLATASLWRSPRHPKAPAMDRLLVRPRASRPRQVGLETHPMIAVRPGQRRTGEVVLTKGSRLLFDWGTDAGSVRTRGLRLSVKVAGRSVLEQEAREGWRAETLSVDGDGTAEIEFAVATTGDAATAPALFIGSPRVYAPDAPPGRILVWISQDTVRADHLSAYGYAKATSPAFDRLSATFSVFEDGAAPASWTLPSLASQFLSRYPLFHGAVREGFTPSPSLASVFDELAEDGFTVLGVTGNPFVSRRFGLASGFDGLWETQGNAASVNALVETALERWHGGDLALFVHYMDAHMPYTPPPPFREAFETGYAGRITGSNFEGLGTAAEARDIAHVTALYDGELAFTDARIGELLESLARRGLLERALVVYSADHGEELLDHGRWTHSRTVYQEMLHVPFALRVPGVAPRRVAQTTSLVDIAPTILDFFSVRRPASFQGRSLLPLLRGEASEPRSVFAETERPRDDLLRLAVRQGSLKYILTTPRGRALPPAIVREEVYDLAADPREAAPLVGSVAEARLRTEAVAYLSRGRREGRRGGEAEVSPEIAGQLKALGYVQ